MVKQYLHRFAGFSVWLAGVIIMAHLLIPHDHHEESGSKAIDEFCVEHHCGHSSKVPHTPVHCHELNDLTFEKSSIAFGVHSFAIDLFLMPETCVDKFATVSEAQPILKPFQESLPDDPLLRAISLRAPPAVS